MSVFSGGAHDTKKETLIIDPALLKYRLRHYFWLTPEFSRGISPGKAGGFSL